MQKALVNPYAHRGPVTGEAFYGREQELEKICQLLSTKPPQNISVYGIQRIGKSSLLQHLCKVVGPQRLPDHTLVYLDMQRIFTPEDFLRRASGALGRPSLEYGDLEEAIERQDKVVVLCLDEFGKPLTSPEFDADFYDFMRSIAQTERLTLIVATLRPLTEIEVPSQADVSRFFNIFQPLQIGPLDEEAAWQLATKPAREAGAPFSDEEVDFVLKVAGRHPYKVQVFCYHLFEAKRAKEPIELNQVLQNYEEEVRATERALERPLRRPVPPLEMAPLEGRELLPALVPFWQRMIGPVTSLSFFLAVLSFLAAVLIRSSIAFTFTVTFLVLAFLGLAAGAYTLLRT